MFDEYIERPSIPIRWTGLFSLQPYFLRFDRPVAVSWGADDLRPFTLRLTAWPAD